MNLLVVRWWIVLGGPEEGAGVTGRILGELGGRAIYQPVEKNFSISLSALSVPDDQQSAAGYMNPLQFFPGP